MISYLHYDYEIKTQVWIQKLLTQFEIYCKLEYFKLVIQFYNLQAFLDDTLDDYKHLLYTNQSKIHIYYQVIDFIMRLNCFINVEIF
jgi:hypothetical protein